MLASAYFLHCFLTLYCSDRSLLPFLNSKLLNYSLYFVVVNLSTAGKLVKKDSVISYFSITYGSVANFRISVGSTDFNFQAP